jgi:hypothetical protein
MQKLFLMLAAAVFTKLWSRATNSFTHLNDSGLVCHFKKKLHQKMCIKGVQIMESFVGVHYKNYPLLHVGLCISLAPFFRT